MAMSRKLTSEALRALYPAPSEDFTRRMADMLEGLPARRKEKPMKKKLTTGVILAFAIMLTTFGALAATLDWNVMDFLFGDREHPARALMQVVDASATDGQVTLTINSALSDGETFAMDWTIVNEKPESPVYVLVNEFTANGERLWTDGNDDFNDCWLPGAYSRDGSMQGGQLSSELPSTLWNADTLDVEMMVGVYYPRLPLWQMDEYDPAAAREKILEGYLVIPEGEGYAELDEEEDSGMAWIMGPSHQNLLENFAFKELRIAFTLDQTAGRASVRQLGAQERYETALFEARYTKAVISPVGLILNMDVFSTDVDWRFKLTDADGKLLETPWPYGEMYGETAEDGSVFSRLKLMYYGLKEEDLPDVISLTYFPEEGEPVLFPLRVRSSAGES